MSKYKSLLSNLVFFLTTLSIIVLLIGVQIKYNLKNNGTEQNVEVNSNIKKLTVIIDAGHGGEDCGAIGKNNVYEKDLNMQISLKLGDYLSSAGYNVVYTRTEDKLLYTEEQNIKGMRKIYDLKNRVEIANSFTDAIFVSIHMNSYGADNCRGLQVYHSDNKSSESLAGLIQRSVINKTQPDNKRQIKLGKDIFILENSSNPAVLIECGFVSNPNECQKLSEKEYQKELSFAILCGIIEYKSKKLS